MTLPLFSRFPGTAVLPLAGIAHLPTPIDAVEHPSELAPELEGAVGGLWVKRDDLTSKLYGGNKVRKLDFLLGDALESGSKAVLTFGAYGSNHALATAVHARALGLEPHVVLSPQEPGPYAPRTLLAHAELGSVIHLVDGWDGRREAVVARQELTGRDGVEPYVIPMGGTCPRGVAAYANAALEVVEQSRDQGRATARPGVSEPDVVYVAAGTLGTAVGLAIGFAAAGRPTRVEAIRVTPLEICNERIAEKIADETAALLRSLDPDFPLIAFSELNLRLRHEFFEPGYGVVTPEGSRAVELGKSRGLRLETTYTGKAFSAMLADARDGLLETAQVLFVDTYSSAAYPGQGRLEDLPPRLQEYVAECRRLFPDV